MWTIAAITRDHNLSKNQIDDKNINSSNFFAWTEYTQLSSIQKWVLRVKDIINDFVFPPDSRWSSSFEKKKIAYRESIKLAWNRGDLHGLQTRIRDLSYLDGSTSREWRPLNSNDILRDFLGYIFDISAARIFLSEKSKLKVVDLPSEYLSRSQRAVSLAFRNLRSLSNRSWLIANRKSGQKAMSHWVESAILYIQCDPRPTLDGILRILGHDTLEDPMGFEKIVGENATWSQHPYTWGSARSLNNRLNRILGQENVMHIAAHSTKPPISKNIVWAVRAAIYGEALRNHGPEE